MKRPIMLAAATTATALLTVGSAYADCRKDLNALPANFSEVAAKDSDLSPGQIRRIHAAAKILLRTGYEDACAELVDVLSGEANSSEHASSNDAAAGDVDSKMVKKADAARPVKDGQGRFSTNGMIGAEVYSSVTGEAVGDIEDILMGDDNDAVVIGHGGLLGMGEKRIKISLEDLKLYPQENLYFVGLSPNEVEGAPAVVKKNNRWVAKPAQAQQQSRMTPAEQRPRKNVANDRGAASDGKSDRQVMRDAGKRIQDNASNAMQTAQRSAEKLVDDAKTAAVKATADARRSEQTRTGSLQKFNSARSDVSANELIGSWVYTSVSDEKVGEVEDFLVSLTGGDHSIILGHGGFLGLGEKRIKIRLDDLSYDPADERYYVSFSDDELKGAAGLKKVDGKWVGKPVEGSQSSYDSKGPDPRTN